MRSTVARRLSTLASFYRYCHVEGVLNRNPAANVRRPKVDHESRTLGLDRNELGALQIQACLGSPRDHALVSVVALNGLWISEALNADVPDLNVERGHRTLRIVRTGGKQVTVPLAPRTARAVDLSIGERTLGPIFISATGQRVNRHGTDRTVKRLARRAGISKRISPHSLRHSFITAALDAGVPLRDVRVAASHADPRTDDALRPRPPKPRPPRHLHRRRLPRRCRTPGVTNTRWALPSTDLALPRRLCVLEPPRIRWRFRLCPEVGSRIRAAVYPTRLSQVPTPRLREPTRLAPRRPPRHSLRGCVGAPGSPRRSRGRSSGHRQTRMGSDR
jgi:hypothetical protein